MGVRILFSDSNLWEICGEAKDGVEAIAKVAELSPDVVILDLTMPAMGGFDTAKRSRQPHETWPGLFIAFWKVMDSLASPRRNPQTDLHRCTARKTLWNCFRGSEKSKRNNNPSGKPSKHRRAGVYFALRNQFGQLDLRILAQVGVLP